MEDVVKVLTFVFGVFTIGGVFALGFVGICKLLKWAPVNIDVTVNVPRED